MLHEANDNKTKGEAFYNPSVNHNAAGGYRPTRRMGKIVNAANGETEGGYLCSNPESHFNHGSMEPVVKNSVYEFGDSEEHGGEIRFTAYDGAQPNG